MEIHLYAVLLARALREDEAAALLRILPEERRERIARLSRPEMGHEPLAAYGALRAALEELYGWRTFPPMAFNRYGKPWFPAHPDVCFNISHTRGAVLVGVHDQPLGVDIEKLRPISERTMRCIADTATEEGFFRAWVRRESRAKWSGEGLTRVRGEDAPLPGERLLYPDVFDGYAACVCTHSAAALAPLRRFTLR